MRARVEIVDQVVRRLDADREPDEARRHGERRVGGRRVRHPRRLLDQALDPAEALRQLPDLRAGDQCDGFLLARREERDHAAEVPHLRRGELMARDASADPDRRRARRGSPARGRRRSPPRSRSASPSGRRASSPRAARARSRTGPGTAPSDFCRKARRSEIASSFVARNPPTTSEWPPRYFVVECRTTSAPSESGCCRYGVAKVLSTTTRAPTACAASAAARMSTRFSSGFVGDSSQTRRVCSSRCSAEPARDLLRGEEREAIPLRLVHLREHPVDAAVHVVDADDVVAG